MKRSAWIASAVTCTLGLGTAFFVGRASASGIPAQGALTYSGFLEDTSGNPVDGAQDITVSLFAAASGGKAVCSTSSPKTTVTKGNFAVQLDDSCVAAVSANPELYAEVAVGGAALGRSKLGAVPFAVEAAHAVEADHAGQADTAATANAAGATLAKTVDDLQNGATAVGSVVGESQVAIQTQSNAYSNVVTLSVTAPANGNFIVTGTARSAGSFNHVMGTPDVLDCCLSDSSGDTCVSGGAGFAVHRGLPNLSSGGGEGIGVPLSMTGVYPVKAGPAKYYFNCRWPAGMGGGVYVQAPTLIALFVPKTL